MIKKDILRSVSLRAIGSVTILIVGFLLPLVLFDSLCDIRRVSGAVSFLYNLVPAVVVATLCLLPRKRLSSVCLLAFLHTVLDVWLISNYMYWKANGLYITWQVAQLAHQLSGVSGSLAACWSWALLLFPLLTILTIGAYACCYVERKRSQLLCMILLSAVLYVGAGICRYHHRKSDTAISREWFSVLRLPETEKDGIWAEDYNRLLFLQMHSVGDYLVKFCCDAIPQRSSVALNDSDREQLRLLLSQSGSDACTTDLPVQGHLIYILVESMEGWLLEATRADGTPLCPNLRHWIDTHPSLYCPNVHSQKLYGESGDGQLICMTGLLPVDDGATCNTYGANVYPNLAHFYPESVCLDASNLLWNKNITMPSYGFRHLIEPKKGEAWWDDSILLEKARQTLSEASEPTCLLVLTMDTHMPFDHYPSGAVLPDTIVGLEHNYMHSFVHEDSLLGSFLTWVDAQPYLQDATIVITGDHYATWEGFAHRPRHACPLIITSPSIREDIRPAEMYQMDIFSTMLDVIGQASYYWRGMGVSFLQDEKKRPLSQEDAYRLSNKLIRTNYFASHP